MVREPVFTETDVEAISQWQDQLRPQKMNQVVGQEEVVRRLEIALKAAQKRKEPLAHVLFDGPPGLGKTTLATVLAEEMGSPITILSGPALSAPKDLLSSLTNAEEASILFIDEIHRLPTTVEEFLYPVMEDFRVDFVLGDGINARTINYQLKPFTIIGATTRSGMLSAPLRDRFLTREHLDFYSVGNLAEIIHRNAFTLKTEISATASKELAKRSRGTPRIANNRLRWVRDYVTSESDGRITLESTRDALKMQGIDPQGLEPRDRKYLDTLIRIFSGGPTGVEAIAHTMNTATDTLRDEIEPYLLRCGYVIRTPRGRIATDTAWQHMGKHPPVEEPDPDTDQGELF